MDWKKYISTNADVPHGKPVIKGTRITVEYILERITHGATVDHIMDTYPHLKRESVFACIAYDTERKINRN
jgi:uncharacterized protein (DUF433 family)